MKGGICLAWKLFFDKNNGDKFGAERPKEDLLALLVEKTKALGRMLTFADASEDPEMVQPNNYAYYFGSFGNAAEIAWRRVRPPNSVLGGLTEQGRKLVKALKRTHQAIEKPCGREVNRMAMVQEEKQKGKGARYTAEEVKIALMDFYNRTGRLPGLKDTQRYDSGLPSWGTMIKFLGPKANWRGVIDSLKTPPSDGVAASREALPVKAEPIVAEVATADPVKIAETVATPDTSANPVEKSPRHPSVPPQDDYDNAEEISEGCGRSNEKVAYAQEDEDIQVETTCQKQDGFIKINTKISLPDMEKPILVTLTI